jgi:TRAP-type C4-dicarboxylate transport system permease small subunit
MMFMTGVFLTYEVTARYVLHAPTTWAQEVSELFLLWGVFLMLGWLIHGRKNIAIDVIYAKLPRGAQRALDILSLAFVFIFLALTVQAGTETVIDSIARGTTTGTMVDIPIFWEEAAVPFGCAWAAVQTAVEFFRAVTGRDWEPGLVTGAEH